MWIQERGRICPSYLYNFYHLPDNSWWPDFFMASHILTYRWAALFLVWEMTFLITKGITVHCQLVSGSTFTLCIIYHRIFTSHLFHCILFIIFWLWTPNFTTITHGPYKSESQLPSRLKALPKKQQSAFSRRRILTEVHIETRKIRYWNRPRFLCRAPVLHCHLNTLISHLPCSMPFHSSISSRWFYTYLILLQPKQ